MLKPTELLTVINARPDILPHLSAEAKIHAFGESAYYKAYERDPKEPGRKQKIKYDKKFADLMKRIFDRQKEDVTPQIAAALYSKADDFNLDWTEEEESEFVSLVMEVYESGVNLFRETVVDGLSDSYINVGMQAAARKYAYDLIKTLGKQLNQTTVEAIRDAISSFAETGVTIGDVVDKLPFSEDRALRIAVTEITRAYATANQETASELQRDLPDMTFLKTWYTNNDDRVCDICGPLHMTSVLIDDTWGGIDNPPGHPNCILPGNKVIAPDLVAAAKSFYNGRAIELRFSSGNTISVTENHPILTPQGWVAAKFLRQGQYAIGTIDGKRMADTINPHNDNTPTAIEDVFRSVKETGSMGTITMKSTAKDFHGDGRFMDGNINIVNVNSFLLRDIVARGLELTGQNNLGGGNIAPLSFQGNSTPSLLIGRHTSSASSSVSGSDLGDTAIGIHISPLDAFTFGLVAGNDIMLEKHIAEGTAIHTDLARQFVFRFASDITLDQIIGITEYNFSGHVYDLQCGIYELYTCNSIIVKNCRCWTDWGTTLGGPVEWYKG